MIRDDYTIFVEGTADVCFISQLIGHIWNVSSAGNHIHQTGGYTNLIADTTKNTYINLMKRTTDDGGVNLVIFDADNDFNERRKTLLDWGRKNNVRFELFLLPDNKGNGELEDLLERIIFHQNKPVMDCWKGYEESLSHVFLPWKAGAPLTIPAKKTKIYAYLEVLLGPSNSEKKKSRSHTGSTTTQTTGTLTP
ncbi:MAG TPA: hypothetical protein IAC04_00975 [Candidatus Coprenecus stercoravium]|uniref:Uncharacterized protein n=1 Tax=Candidatus Coprenecus stercoravium TaxID=2840735 RepID=A0A9D2GP28_9BACT|nr:hypothetical protein [Candidatus Coprenecus stercoravium]